MAGCDTSLADNQQAALLAESTAPAAEVDAEAADYLAKAVLADVDDTRAELEGDTDEGDPPDLAPPPCFDDIRQAIRLCVEETRGIAAACVEAIEQLFEAGEPEAAHEEAVACVEQINQHSEDCLQVLRELCANCLNDLLDNDAPMGVIEALLRQCHRHAERSNEIARGAWSCALVGPDSIEFRRSIQGQASDYSTQVIVLP